VPIAAWKEDDDRSAGSAIGQLIELTRRRMLCRAVFTGAGGRALDVCASCSTEKNGGSVTEKGRTTCARWECGAGGRAPGASA